MAVSIPVRASGGTTILRFWYDPTDRTIKRIIIPDIPF